MGAIPHLGCQADQSTFQIIDYRNTGEPVPYHESFDEAFYHVSPDGNLDLVLRRREPSTSDPLDEITQVVHIRSLWRSIPGRTIANKTQINATISYLIVGGSIGATFEGAGSVFFKENRAQDELTGAVEYALLKPTRRLTDGAALFESAQIEGEFRAVKDRRRVLRVLHEMNRLFGPLPPFRKAS